MCEGIEAVALCSSVVDNGTDCFGCAHGSFSFIKTFRKRYIIFTCIVSHVSCLMMFVIASHDVLVLIQQESQSTSMW